MSDKIAILKAYFNYHQLSFSLFGFYVFHFHVIYAKIAVFRRPVTPDYSFFASGRQTCQNSASRVIFGRQGAWTLTNGNSVQYSSQNQPVKLSIRDVISCGHTMRTQYTHPVTTLERLQISYR